jgi:hypothetical protein
LTTKDISIFGNSSHFEHFCRYYQEDGIENCHELSLQAANQVLLLFGLIENPRWPPAGEPS